MRGPERVVDVDVGVGRERRGEGRVVRLLLGVEAEVLEQQHLARSQALDRVLGPDPERVAGHRARSGASSWVRRCPTGRRRSPSWTLPFGRPRWLARMTEAPCAEE